MSEETVTQAENKPVGDPIKGSVLKSSAVMAAGTLLSRILGFIRWSLLIVAIGGLAANDAFQIANNLPNTVYNLLAAGVLDAILVPQIVRAFKSRSGSDYVNRLITLAGTILFGMTLLTLLGASVLVNIFAVEMSPGWKSLAIVFSLWCLPQIFFYGLYNLLGETLNARGIFGPYTWVPVVNNLIGIAGLLVFIWVYGGASNADDPSIWTFERTALLAGPATLGVIVQALLLFIPLRKAGIRIRPDFKFRGAGLRSASKIAGWMFAVLLVNQLSIISTTNIAAAANNWREITGQYAPSITAVNFTFMIYMMPQSIITTSIAIAVFTRIASAVADNDLPQVSRDFHFGVRVTTVLNLWAAAILGAGAVPIFQALAPGTGQEQVYGTALALVVMLPGLGVAAISMFSHRVFFALEDGRPILLSVLAPTVAFVVASWILKAFLPGYLWVTAALAAEALMRLGVAWLSLQFVAARIPGVRKGQIVQETGVYFGIALASGLAAYGLLLLVNPYAPGASYSVQLLGAAWRGILVVLVVTVVYLLLLGIFAGRSFDGFLQAVGNRIPIVKQFGEKLPQVNLVNAPTEAAEAEPVADFFTSGKDPAAAVWFTDQLAVSSGFKTLVRTPAAGPVNAPAAGLAGDLVETSADDAADNAADGAPVEALKRGVYSLFATVFEQLYQWAVIFQPAPVKHAAPAAEAASDTAAQPTDAASPQADQQSLVNFASQAHRRSQAYPVGASGALSTAQSELPAVNSEFGDSPEFQPSHPTAAAAAGGAAASVNTLASYITPALSKLRSSTSSKLRSDRSGAESEPAPSEISFKNGIMVETLHRGTRAISQSLESARQTVDDFQAGKHVDPTKPTIVIFVIATLVAFFMALATLGLLPSGGSHLDKGAAHPTAAPAPVTPAGDAAHLAK